MTSSNPHAQTTSAEPPRGRLFTDALYFKMALLFFALFPLLVHAQCPLVTSYAKPFVADGYTLQLVANDLRIPRHIVFDSAGNLLVSGDRLGIIALVLEENNGCVSVKEKKVVAENENLDLYHGLTISKDGQTIYASSSEAAYAWSYNSSTLTTSSRRAVVTGMSSGGHITRTLMSSPSYPDFLIISRGSDGDIDPGTADINTGRSQLKAFNISALPSNTSYNFNTDGILLGWGLRNSVGVGEDPQGGIWSVENSANIIIIEGVDIHQENPAEEMNWHGYLNETLTQANYQAPNYGYPTCLTTWNSTIIPYPNLKTGTPFPLSPGDTCNATRAPRISFDSHIAPLDIKFNPRDSSAWVTFHGSAERKSPAGYKISYIPFASDGQPEAAEDSMSAVVDVVWSPNLAVCPKGCTRPVGLAFDAKGRVWWSGDQGGEVWVLTPPPVPEDNDNETSTGGGGSGGGDTGTAEPVVEGGAGRARVNLWSLVVVGIALGGCLW